MAGNKVYIPIVPTEDIFIPAKASDAIPKPTGSVGSAGTSTDYARADHRHVGGGGGGSTSMFAAIANEVQDPNNVWIILDHNKDNITQIDGSQYNIPQTLRWDLPKKFTQGWLTFSINPDAAALIFKQNYPPAKRTLLGGMAPMKPFFVSNNAAESARFTSLIANESSESTWTELGSDDLYGKKSSEIDTGCLERGIEGYSNYYTSYMGSWQNQFIMMDGSKTSSSAYLLCNNAMGGASFDSNNNSQFKITPPKRVNNIGKTLLFDVYFFSTSSNNPTSSYYLGNIQAIAPNTWTNLPNYSGNIYYWIQARYSDGSNIYTTDFDVKNLYLYSNGNTIPLYSALTTGNYTSSSSAFIVQNIWIDTNAQTLNISIIPKSQYTLYLNDGQFVSIGFFGDPETVQE